MIIRLLKGRFLQQQQKKKEEERNSKKVNVQ